MSMPDGDHSSTGAWKIGATVGQTDKIDAAEAEGLRLRRHLISVTPVHSIRLLPAYLQSW